MLHEIWPSGLYCGPSVLIAALGWDYKTVIRPMINQVRNRPPERGVMRMHNHELGDVLKKAGCRTHSMNFRLVGHMKRNLKMFVDDLGSPLNGSWIINVTDHYVAWDGAQQKVFDNRTRFGAPIEGHWCRRKRVDYAWRLCYVPTNPADVEELVAIG